MWREGGEGLPENCKTRIRVRIESGQEYAEPLDEKSLDEMRRGSFRALRKRLSQSGNLTEQEIDELFALLQGEGCRESGEGSAVHRWIAAKVAAGKLQRMPQNR